MCLIINTLIGNYVYFDYQIKRLVSVVKNLIMVVGYRYPGYPQNNTRLAKL